MNIDSGYFPNLVVAVGLAATAWAFFGILNLRRFEPDAIARDIIIANVNPQTNWTISSLFDMREWRPRSGPKNEAAFIFFYLHLRVAEIALLLGIFVSSVFVLALLVRIFQVMPIAELTLALLMVLTIVVIAVNHILMDGISQSADRLGIKARIRLAPART